MAELAAHLRVPVKTIYDWNTKDSGPRYLRPLRDCLYTQADIDSWADAHEVEIRGYTAPRAASTAERRYLTVEEVAALTHTSKHALYHLNCHGGGPRFLRLGRHVRYLESDVLAWLVVQSEERFGAASDKRWAPAA
ncbi:helix-turn-helix domain-containing protein [Gryllotalpicola daejeonensis]|uniref:helix-turn-helix domain-containing protein n=1 Tax=Gryllotalpicola daejeonensis TaxID=993087 RepID=UPI0031D60BFB